MSGAYNMFESDKKCLHSFCWETWRKETTYKA